MKQGVSLVAVVRDGDKRWWIAVPATFVLGHICALLHVPAAWVVAAILVAATCALVGKKEMPPAKPVTQFAKSAIAVIAASPITATPFHTLTGYILPGITVAAITLFIGFTGGILLARTHAEISRETGVLSMLAGGASVLPFLAQDVGADFRYVTLTQYLRLFTVTISLPFAATLIGYNATAGSTSLLPTDPRLDGKVVGLIILAAIMIVGDRFGQLIRLPAPSMLGPMLLTVIMRIVLPASIPLVLPHACAVVAFACIGWMAGGNLSAPALKKFASQLPATILFIAVLMGGCALSALLLVWWAHVPYFDAYLATTPGGLEAVLVIAAEGHAGSIVPAVQIIRLVSVLVMAGWLPTILTRMKTP